MGRMLQYSKKTIPNWTNTLRFIDEAPCLISNPDWSDDDNESYTGSRQRREMFTAFQFPGQKGSNDLKQNMMRSLLLDHLANDWRDIIPTIHVRTMIIMGGKSHFAS